MLSPTPVDMGPPEPGDRQSDYRRLYAPGDRIEEEEDPGPYPYEPECWWRPPHDRD